MSPILIAAIIGLVGVAILAPFTNHLLARYRESRPHLRATLSVHDISIPTFLKEYLRKDFYTIPSTIEPELRKKLEILSSLHSYMRLTLHNAGNEKIESLTITAVPSIGDLARNYLFQIEGQTDLRRSNEGKVLIGDLQPHQDLILHIWSETVVENWHYPMVKNLFKITADKLYKRTFRFPFPIYLGEYLREKIGQWVSISLIIFVPLLLLLNGLYWLYKIYITHEASF
jgi:hypothetical protein